MTFHTKPNFQIPTSREFELTFMSNQISKNFQAEHLNEFYTPNQISKFLLDVNHLMQPFGQSRNSRGFFIAENQGRMSVPTSQFQNSEWMTKSISHGSHLTSFTWSLSLFRFCPCPAQVIVGHREKHKITFASRFPTCWL